MSSSHLRRELLWSPRCGFYNGGCRVHSDGVASVVALFLSSFSDRSDRAAMSRVSLFIQRTKRRITKARTAINRSANTSKGVTNYDYKK